MYIFNLFEVENIHPGNRRNVYVRKFGYNFKNVVSPIKKPWFIYALTCFGAEKCILSHRASIPPFGPVSTETSSNVYVNIKAIN